MPFETCTPGARPTLVIRAGPLRADVGAGGFSFSRMGARGVPMRAREALVSRAKRGVLGECFRVFWGVAGVLGARRVLRTLAARGSPRATGCLVNLDSTDVEVRRSSKASSSVPSPKARRRVGLVRVRLAAASLTSDCGAISLRCVGVTGR